MTEAGEQAVTGSSAAGRAKVLWVVVGAGLLFGIVNTVSKALQLFTG
ncbi:MAG: hypothetical protein M3P39_05115 [Actinomycetota bacterium]|nr:hypothetical protein [Actinomycetota bacterium]